MRRYETTFILSPELEETELEKNISRYSEIITSRGGTIEKEDRWGMRRLAYMIRKQARGFYLLFDYTGESAAVNELERNLKINDRILKFMTVLKAERVDREALEKEIAELERQIAVRSDTG